MTPTDGTRSLSRRPSVLSRSSGSGVSCAARADGRRCASPLATPAPATTPRKSSRAPSSWSSESPSSGPPLPTRLAARSVPWTTTTYGVSSSRASADFHRILIGTGERAGFNTRPLGYYRDAWRALAPANHVRLSFASRGGSRLATLFHVTCGDHAAELYGGATSEGTDTHANYLVK